jgi:hypothetical protein
MLKKCFPVPKIFPARENLISDIPAGDGKIANPFLQCGNKRQLAAGRWGEGGGGVSEEPNNITARSLVLCNHSILSDFKGRF